MEPKPNIVIRFLVLCRNLIGLGQVILVIGGCLGIVSGDTEEFSAAVQLFLIFLVFQIAILALIWLLSPKKNKPL